jgi:hypothetical protein
MVALDGMIHITLHQIGMDHPQILILLDKDFMRRENILFAIDVED